MTSSESRERPTFARAAGWLVVALLALPAAACIGFGGEDRSASLQSTATPAEATGSWLQRQQLQFSAGLGQMRDQVDGVLGNARDGAGEALRRATSRAIVASDACLSIDETEGCKVAARNACQRASYRDGAPLASSTYFACSGVWGMQAGNAPDGACKTKRRLNAALCW